MRLSFGFEIEGDECNGRAAVIDRARASEDVRARGMTWAFLEGWFPNVECLVLDVEGHFAAMWCVWRSAERQVED
jgi:hypothetical protein